MIQGGESLGTIKLYRLRTAASLWAGCSLGRGARGVARVRVSAPLGLSVV